MTDCRRHDSWKLYYHVITRVDTTVSGLDTTFLQYWSELISKLSVKLLTVNTVNSNFNKFLNNYIHRSKSSIIKFILTQSLLT